jgi:hypothetical protein
MCGAHEPGGHGDQGGAPVSPGPDDRLGLGAGASPPRAWPASDAQVLDLSGS